MVVFPHCKINLGLRVTAKRADGFHDLETVFYPVPITDVLEIVHSPVNENIFNSTGIALPGNSTDNLCLRAWELLRQSYPSLPHVAIHLHKIIPPGAGLGGGSSDGAFTLSLLNQKFGLNLTREQLLEYALRLGSDCPYFLVNDVVIATGRGEKMQPVQTTLKGLHLVVINPGIHISTATAFSRVRPGRPKNSLSEIIQEDVRAWKGKMINDFEQPMCELYPEIKDILDALYKQGALYAAMTGTGSTVFGLFDTAPELPSLPSHYFKRSLICEL